MGVKVVRVAQASRLGRQVVHDEESRRFPHRVSVDRSSWRDKAVRVYDPLPNPDQFIGDCTGCAKAMQFNSVGSRRTGAVLGMGWADQVYSRATALDPWSGEWPPDDTGSSGLASAEAAQELGEGGEYRWLFGGVDEVVQTLMSGRSVDVGTWWYGGMWDASLTAYGLPLVSVSGVKVGGHQFLARGYDVATDLVLLRCWWGTWRDWWMRRGALGELLADDGDAHVQDRAAAPAGAVRRW